MIAMYTARTSEVDDIDEAISEIKEQIDFSKLKKNSAGLIFCHVDFVESGMAAALSAALPFDVIGMTSMVCAEERGYSLFDLALTVLTSDELTFKAGMTGGVTSENYVQEIENLYARLRLSMDDDPTMIFSFMPYTRDVPGYSFVKVMDSVCNGIPIWGSITTSNDFNYETVHTIYNTETLRSGLAMLCVQGPVKADFIVSSLPERNMLNSRAIITKSKGAVVYEINGIPILEYLGSLGLLITKENITTTPLLLYFDDRIDPVAIGFYTLFEDGSVLAGCDIPEGTSISVGSIDAEGIFESTEQGLKKILACEDREATILLPCVTRYLMLAPEQERELQLIIERLSNCGKPFMMGYSGGEICPVPGPDGKYHNQFHNYAFCGCVLR